MARASKIYLTLSVTVLLAGCSSTLTGTPGTDAGGGTDLGSGGDTSIVVDSGNPSDMTTSMDEGTPGPDGSIEIDFGPPVDAGPPEAGDFYVSTTGNDSNPGTIDMPFRTLTRLNDALLALGGDAAGKIAYIRGGTYLSDESNDASVHFILHDLHGTAEQPIRIWAYPGEHPVFSCANITPTYLNPFAFYLQDSSYVHLKGLKITTLRQVASGTGISRGFNLSRTDHSTIELIEVCNMSGSGIAIEGSNFNHILNCDSHHNGDGLGDPAFPEYGTWNTGDGWGDSGGDDSHDNVYEGCRAYLNSDDGYDWFDWAGTRVTLIGCWSFWNGIKPWGPTNTQPNEAEMTPTDPSVFFNNDAYVVSRGAGEGFKLGGHGSAGPEGMPTVLKKYLVNCVSFENSGTGYSENMLAEFSHQMSLVNCTAYGNANDGFGFGVGRSVGIAHVFRNDLAYDNNRVESGAGWVYDGLADNISNNYWSSVYMDVNYGNVSDSVTVTDDDFMSVSSAGAAGPRGPDGSLPNLPFLRLAPGSDLIDRGIDVGATYNGAAPDIGAYESP